MGYVIHRQIDRYNYLTTGMLHPPGWVFMRVPGNKVHTVPYMHEMSHLVKLYY